MSSYRAQAQGSDLNLHFRFLSSSSLQSSAESSETPSQTEILVKGICKQAVSQAAADIRSYRPVEAIQRQGRTLC